MKKRFVFTVAAGLFLGLFIKLFCFDILYVSGVSMEPALNDGQAVLVNKLVYGLVKPFRGEFFVQWAEPSDEDIVIFLHDDKIVVKRCVAVGGAQLDFSDDTEYTLSVNGKKIVLTESQFRRMSQFTSVPEGYALVLGDNYSESLDSRSYGFVSTENIIGKVIIR